MCSIPGLPSKGSSVALVITRINFSPSSVLVEFWGSFDQDRKIAYQQLKKEIQYPCEGFCESDGTPGDLCLVRVYETWYRARIESREAQEYNVFLIDEGRTLCVTADTLAWGKSDYFYLPAEVEFCVLANVLPLSHENKWSTMAQEFMKTFCGRRVNATVQDVIVAQRTFLLDIPCLSRQMCEMGFSKKLDSDQFKEFVLRSFEAKIRAVELKKISCKRNKPDDLEKKDKQLAYMYPELQTNTVETVVVTEVMSPIRIFCQLKVFSQELKKLTAQITQYYEGRTGCNFARSENLGLPCASRGSDDKWYRSVLQQILSDNDLVEVLHVDYGKKQFVQAQNVRPLVSEFVRMPIVTYVCSLHGIVDQGVGWTASEIEFLKSLLLNRTVIAKFQYQSLSEGVQYVTLYGEENVNINRLFGMKSQPSLQSEMNLTNQAVEKNSFKKLGTADQTLAQETYSDLNVNKPVFFSESLNANTSHVAVVQHIESPGKFWIQTQRFADEFDQLMHDLESLYCDSTSTQGLIKNPVVGLLCAAKAQDGSFYRAAVKNVSDKTADVYFLDYGDVQAVDSFNLRQLPLRFQHLPAVAVKCSLYGILSRQHVWEERATLFFSKLVEDRVLDLHVHEKQEDSHVVRLVDQSLDGENDVGKLLCSAGYAREVKSTLEYSINKPQTTRTSYVFLPPTQPQIPLVSPVMTDSVSVFKEYLFPIGSSLEVIVSYIESPNDFWCQKLSNAKCLDLLMQDIQCFYEQSKFEPLLEAACVARHPDTGIWYRALVIQKHLTPHVDVLLVDYGHMKKVAIEDLRKISPAFLKMKGQAFRCSLYNLIHPVPLSNSNWSTEATLKFQEFVQSSVAKNVPLKCTIFAVMYDSQKVVYNVVDLETPFQSICNLLVQSRLADRAPSKKSSLPSFRLDTYYYSTHGLKIGYEEKVSTTCVKSVNQFFCHLVRNSDELEKLTEKVTFLCHQLKLTKCPQTFGTVCFAKFTDGCWYRGQIKSTKPSVVVNFVDYGDTMQVDSSNLLPVPIEAGEIMSVPVQAVECALSDMPEEVPLEMENWFCKFADSHRFTALIVAKDPGGKLIVELFEGKTQVNSLIKQMFHSSINKYVPTTIQDHGSKNTCEEQMRAGMKGSTTAVKRVLDLPQSHEHHLLQRAECVDSKQQNNKWRYQTERKNDPKPGFGTFNNFQKHPEPLRKARDQAADWRASTSVTTYVGNPKPQTLLKESALPVKAIKPGLEVEVFVSHCNTPCSFFIQFAADEDEIFSLVEKLNSDKSRCGNVNTNDIHEGDLVCAMFPEDNSWYRAAVRKTTGDNIDVEFVDFGNTAVVSASKICHLNDSFTSVPRYSIHCSLHKLNVHLEDQELAPNFKQVIEQNVDMVLCNFVKMSGNIWEVKLNVNGVVLGNTPKDYTKPQAENHSDVQHQTFNISAKYKAVDISVGQVISGYSSFVKGPHLFWCQSEDSNNLQEISDVLQNTGNVSDVTLSEEALSVGGACVALSTEDNLWYRAKVTSKDNEELFITFVDYGDETKVNVKDVKALPLQLSDIPPQAFCCQLEGFDLSEGFWDIKAEDAFFDLLNEQLLTITFEKIEASDIPHSVKVACNGSIINDLMRKFWKSQSLETPSTDLTSEAELASGFKIDSVVHIDEDAICTESEFCSVQGMETSEQDQFNLLSSTGFEIEAEGEQLKIVHENTGSPDAPSIVPPEIEETLETVFSCCLSDTNLPVSKETDAEPILLSTPVPQHFEETSECSGNIDRLLVNHDSQRCIVEEPETSSNEIIKSELGYLKRATEKVAIGAECAIWSQVRRKWCNAQVLKVTEETALVLLLDFDAEVVVDLLNIYEVLPEELLESSCTEADARSVDETMDTNVGLQNSDSDAEEAELDVSVAVDVEATNDEEETLLEQVASDVELIHQSQDESSVSGSVVLVEDFEVGDAVGIDDQVHCEFQEVVELNPENMESKEPFENLSTSAEEQGDGVKMRTGVELLMDFLDLAPDDQVLDVSRTGVQSDILVDVTDDLIVLTSDDGAESDTASDGTLLRDPSQLENHGSKEKLSGSDRTSDAVPAVTHLTLKVEDSADDVIFVGVLQESSAEVSEAESRNDK